MLSPSRKGRQRARKQHKDLTVVDIASRSVIAHDGAGVRKTGTVSPAATDLIGGGPHQLRVVSAEKPLRVGQKRIVQDPVTSAEKKIDE